MLSLTLALATVALSAASLAGDNLPTAGTARFLEDAEEATVLVAIAGYSIKYAGCITEKVFFAENMWDAGGDDNVENLAIVSDSFVRYNMCPSASCSDKKAIGCDDDEAGKYFMEMSTYLAAQIAWQTTYNEEYCNSYYEAAEYEAQAAGEDMDEENFAWPSQCQSFIDEANGYDVIDFAEFVECTEVEDANGIQHYVTFVCDVESGGVVLAAFTDEACSTTSSYSIDTIFAREVLYDDSSMMAGECISCEEDTSVYNEEDGEDADATLSFCSTLYAVSAKCEPEAMHENSDQSSCSHLNNLEMVRSDGTYSILSVGDSASRAAAVAVGLFSLSTLCLGAFTLYKRGELEKRRVDLN